MQTIADLAKQLFWSIHRDRPADERRDLLREVDPNLCYIGVTHVRKSLIYMDSIMVPQIC